MSNDDKNAAQICGELGALWHAYSTNNAGLDDLGHWLRLNTEHLRKLLAPSHVAPPLKRYEFCVSSEPPTISLYEHEGDKTFAGMDEQPDGAWVRYDEVFAPSSEAAPVMNEPFTHPVISTAPSSIVAILDVLNAALYPQSGCRLDDPLVAARTLVSDYKLLQCRLEEARSAVSAIEPTLPADILALCRQRGWNLHWTHRGAYLHLEASELIEALRGKRGDPLHEAADVLLVLMSITENAGLSWDAVLQKASATCEELKTRPRYEGEEFEAVKP